MIAAKKDASIPTHTYYSQIMPTSLESRNVNKIFLKLHIYHMALAKVAIWIIISLFGTVYVTQAVKYQSVDGNEIIYIVKKSHHIIFSKYYYELHVLVDLHTKFGTHCQLLSDMHVTYTLLLNSSTQGRSVLGLLLMHLLWCLNSHTRHLPFHCGASFLYHAMHWVFVDNISSFSFSFGSRSQHTVQ